MTTATMTRPPTRSRTVTGHERDVASRLTKASGQLGGVHAMYDNGRYCIDVLDQLSAVAAATGASGTRWLPGSPSSGGSSRTSCTTAVYSPERP